MKTFPLQASLRRNPAPDPRFDPSAPQNALGPLTFEVGQRAIFLGRAYYGCVATILPDVSAGLSRKVQRFPPCCSHVPLLSRQSLFLNI